MPAFISTLLDMLRNPEVDFGAAADKLRLDPGMTANVLRLANSARFGAARSIGSVRDAMVRLGLNRLFEVVVATHAAQQLAQPLAGYELQPAELLNHALWTALAAEELCKQAALPQPDMLFTAGLLHNLGKVVLDPFVRDHQAGLLELVRRGNCTFDAAETTLLGWSHAEAGAALLDRWHLPDVLVACARYQHRPQEAGLHQTPAAVIHVAQFLAYSEGVGAGVDGLHYQLADAAVKQFGVDKRMVEYIASQTLDKVNYLRSTILA
jgi:HD-like signal output (HDOD) protein